MKKRGFFVAQILPTVLTLIIFLNLITICHNWSVEEREYAARITALEAEVVAAQEERDAAREVAANAEEQLVAAHVRIDELEALVEMLEDVQSYFGNNPINLTREEEIELKTLAMAEGESEGVIGKALIMCTVFNRMKEGSSVHDIVFGGAYNVTAAGGRYYTVVPDEECEIALLMVAAGWDGSQGAKYFCTGGYSTYGEPLFRYKNHYFSA